MLDPGGIANWSITYVDWSEGKWHPRSFRARDITYQVMKNIAVCGKFYSFPSDVCFFFFAHVESSNHFFFMFPMSGMVLKLDKTYVQSFYAFWVLLSRISIMRNNGWNGLLRRKLSL